MKIKGKPENMEMGTKKQEVKSKLTRKEKRCSEKVFCNQITGIVFLNGNQDTTRKPG